ncbi:YIP1 family protein [Candidatus Woesearchaeota archaeon]|nr:YIP1 family protein [Candidatus Woesearchaeota archaeon]
MNKYVEKLKHLFFNTKTFFNTVTGEREYMPILLFFVVVYAISQLIEVISSIPVIVQTSYGQPLMGIFSFFITLFAALFGVALAFATPWISAGINHLGVMIFGGKQGFFNTFKPSTYAMMIGMIYNAIAAVILFFVNMFYPMPLQVETFAEIPFVTIGIAIVIGIIAFIHTLYAEVIGIAKFQRMSKGRALMAVLILPIMIVLVVLVFGLGLFFVGRFAGF